MFYHRVLPAPSSFDITAIPASSSTLKPFSSVSGNTNEDSMTTRSASLLAQEKSRQFGLQEQDGQHHQSKNPTQDTDFSSPGSLRASLRLSREKELSRSPPVLIRRESVSTRLPSIPREGELVDQALPSETCLCQPEPKIPRPRNAFILFRQHHQIAVAQQNPGLPNPDISKIIGDSWNSSTEETRQQWKNLAELEKLRHQKQYPDYQYRPRRAGKNSVVQFINTDPNTNRCLRCGGKTMIPYNNLPTPGTPVSPISNLTGPGMSGNTILSRGSRYIGSPSHRSSETDPRRFPTQNPDSSLSFHKRESSHQMGPDAKRRRYEGPISPGQYSSSLNVPPSFSQAGRRSSMPQPEKQTRSHSIPIPRHPMSGHPSRAPGPALAPLQINKQRDLVSRAQAVEAMVMSIPAMNKIKVLAKISPPLASPSPASPPFEIRGAVIAIEGSDETAMKVTTASLVDYLERDGRYEVQVLLRSIPTPFQDTKSWIDTIRSYHDESTEIIRYITTVPTSDTPTPLISYSNLPSITSLSPLEISPTTTFKRRLPPISTAQSATTKAIPTKIPIIIIPRYQLSLTDLAASQIPISDEYSPTDHWQWMATLWRGIIGPDITIDIRLSGSPVASAHTHSPKKTLSAAVAAAAARDLGSIANVRPANVAGASSGAGAVPASPRDTVMTGMHTPAIGSSGVGDTSAGGNSGGNLPVVDVRLADARAVFLRGEADGHISEAGLRRMGFEVSEWLRDVEVRKKGS